VVLKDRLERFLRTRYPNLPDESIQLSVARFSRPEGADLLRRNSDLHLAATQGVDIPVEIPGRTRIFEHVSPVDWDNPDANDFLVVNQLPISGQNDRRPDILIFVNGLPLVLFELKNPWEPHFTVEHALNQIAHYRNDIPQVFEFNAVTVISDGITTLHGMWPSSLEWFAPWQSIDGVTVEDKTIGSMKVLVEGLFPKERLLAYIRNFIVFDQSNDKITKKGAKYHQFFAVNLAVEKTREAFRGVGDHRVGLIWHTTGSGKSLSMIFLIGILRRELDNPAILVQVDATDLDGQLADQFVAARNLVGDVKHAEGMDDLRAALRTQGGEIIFTTLQKFQLKEGEIEHPVLTDRSDLLVIADEAHRSQYGFMQGYARYLREALPHAKFLGFTGTPISLAGADTVAVFGDVIHSYDIKQSQIDGTTVPIYYEPRMARLNLANNDIDAALQEVAADEDPTQLERKKSRWAALASAAGARERVEQIATDLLAHYHERTATLDGKAMVVCMTRENCVKLHEAMTSLPGCPDVAVVMTGDLMKDPAEWSKAGHITTKKQREAIKQRMIDADDPLSIVIVCDMWLTGTDIPCLHTLYIDKPMKGHTIIQAISRVNRVFRDKPSGLVVDYIGIGDDLREATNRYSKDGGQGEPAPNIDVEGPPLLRGAVKGVRETLLGDFDYGDWRRLSHIELEDRYALIWGYLTDDDERRNAFLEAEARATRAFLLVKHLDSCRGFADELIFYQRVRKQLLKAIPGDRAKSDVEQAVRDLVDDSIESEDVIDIFKAAGIDRPDLSILDDEFLQTFKDRPHQDLRVNLFQKLLGDEIRSHERSNLAVAKSFQKRLEETLLRYHRRLIDAAAVIQEMIEIRRELLKQYRRAEELGITEEELAFYDAIASKSGKTYSDEFLRDLVHEIVQSVKRNLKVDWTAPHRDDVRAAVRSAVKRTLRARGVQTTDFDPFVEAVMEQAVRSFAAWPLVAA
jgi:type I restriction enzyme, R subunit